MTSPLQLRPALTAASNLRRQDPTHFLRLLEAHLSALIDSKDVEGWTVNPAYHPDVLAFIRQYSHHAGFAQRGQGLQQNRARYFAKIRGDQLGPTQKKTVLNVGRSTEVHPDPMPMAVPYAVPTAIDFDPRVLPVAQVLGRIIRP